MDVSMAGIGQTFRGFSGPVEKKLKQDVLMGFHVEVMDNPLAAMHDTVSMK